MTDEQKGPKFTPPLSELDKAKLTVIKSGKLLDRYKSELNEYRVIVKDQRELIDAYKEKADQYRNAFSFALFLICIQIGIILTLLFK